MKKALSGIPALILICLCVFFSLGDKVEMIVPEYEESGLAWAKIVYESITVTSATAVGIDFATYAPSTDTTAKNCICTIETAAIRIRMDGTDPTGSEGHLVAIGDKIKLEGYTEISLFKAIADTATSGVLKCSCY